MVTPDARDLIAQLHATTTRDDRNRLAAQLRTAGAWALLIATPLAVIAVVVAVVWSEVGQ